MFQQKSHHILLLCVFVTFVSAVLQYLYPSFSLFDGGLIIGILLTVFLKEDSYTWLFGVISVGLVMLATSYSPENINRRQLIIQHLFTLGIITMAVLVVLYIKQLYRAIEADQHQFKALFEHATEGIILTDQQGRIVLVNPAITVIFGHDRNELPGQLIEVLIPPRFRQRHAEERVRYYEQPCSRAMGSGRELYGRKKDGSEFPVEVSLSHYRQGSQLFVIAFVVDISRRQQAEKELLRRQQQLENISSDVRKLNGELETKVEERTTILRKALQELERSQEELHTALSKEKELNEIKSRFVSMASHEFRTPLSTILSSTNLLSRYTLTEDQEKRDKHIKRTREAVKHLNNLLDDFLSLGRLEEGRLGVELTSFTIIPLLEEAIEEMQTIIKPGQQIDVECATDVPLITDKRMLKNILINLLSNAIKFSPDQAAIRLAVRYRPDQTMAITVEDQGIGISAEDQQHLFSSFFRGANAVNIEGTGLGLHIVRRYLDLLHGAIRLDSALDKGTQVTFQIPSKLL